MLSFGLTRSQRGFLKLEKGSKDSFQKSLDYFELQVMPRLIDEVVTGEHISREKMQAFA